MALLDTYLSDKEKSILEKRRAKIASAFFWLFFFIILLSFFAYNILSQIKEDSPYFYTFQQYKNWLLLSSTLITGVLVWILFGLIRPTYITYLDLISDLLLIKNNENTEQQKISTRENTLLRFRELNYAVNNTVLYATIEDENRIAYISKKFEDYLGLNEDLTYRKFEEILTYKHNQQHKIKKILATAKNELVRHELKLTNHKDEIYWIDISIFKLEDESKSLRRMIVCNDITKRKEYDLNLQQINRDRFAAEVQSQKDLAQQIMAAQEDERKRIAKDIHDGIGQMLTALRFSIDGINLNNLEESKTSLENLKTVFGDLIKDVRAVTFSLAPPELTDHGIGSAIRKMCNTVGSIAKRKILYENTTEFNGRLEKNVEINIYRVVQEAINNALKYAHANYILVTLSHTDAYLKITIEDDGVGFDLNTINFEDREVGHGLRFMKERVDYIQGKIIINSQPSKGTNIQFAVPI